MKRAHISIVSRQRNDPSLGQQNDLSYLKYESAHLNCVNIRFVANKNINKEFWNSSSSLTHNFASPHLSELCMHCAMLINNKVWLRCLKRNHQNFNVPQWWTIDLSTMFRKTTKIISFGSIWKYIKMLLFITRFISTYYAKTPLHELTYHKMILSFCICLLGVYFLTRISKNQLNSCN